MINVQIGVQLIMCINMGMSGGAGQRHMFKCSFTQDLYVNVCLCAYIDKSSKWENILGRCLFQYRCSISHHRPVLQEGAPFHQNCSPIKSLEWTQASKNRTWRTGGRPSNSPSTLVVFTMWTNIFTWNPIPHSATSIASMTPSGDPTGDRRSAVRPLPARRERGHPPGRPPHSTQASHTDRSTTPRSAATAWTGKVSQSPSSSCFLFFFSCGDHGTPCCWTCRRRLSQNQQRPILAVRWFSYFFFFFPQCGIYFDRCHVWPLDGVWSRIKRNLKFSCSCSFPVHVREFEINLVQY